MINAAADLFHKQGVRATSPQQIMETSQTGKSQLYHYFRSKGGLVHEVLQHHIQSIREGSAAIEYDITPGTISSGGSARMRDSRKSIG
jgi:AcrR family transcriptional regulator